MFLLYRSHRVRCPPELLIAIDCTMTIVLTLIRVLVYGLGYYC